MNSIDKFEILSIFATGRPLTLSRCGIIYSGIRALNAAARNAEVRKQRHYSEISSRYKFVPIAVETSGVLGPATSKFIRELGQLITARTGERRETEWLRQRLSMALVRGNAAAVLATATTDRAKGRLPPPPPLTASPLASAVQTEPYSRSEPPTGEPSTSARPAAEAV